MTLEIRELIINTHIGNPPPPRTEVTEQELAQFKEQIEENCLKAIQAETVHRTDER